jgi:hypothetical protein
MALIWGVNSANAILGYLLGNTTPAGAGAVPATYYVAAYTVAPTGAGTGGGGTEVTGGAYARVSVTNNTTNFPAPAAQAAASGTAITFPAASATWGTIVAIGLFDAASGGNFKFGYTLPTPVPINSGDVFSVPAGFLTSQAYGE